MSAERLAELRRQRALVQEHLAWLDREIDAAETADSSKPISAKETSSPAASASSTPLAKSSSAVAGSTDEEADAILARFRTEPTAMREDVRKGCLLYFIVGCAVFAAAVVGLYFALRH